MITDHLLTISMFSKITLIPRKTLIYYDSIGLLKPEVYGENKYRYYSLKQVDISYIITTLRSLDVSIQEIKTYLSNRNPELGVSFFGEQLKRIDQKIEHMQELKKYINHQLKTTSEGFNAVLGKPSIQLCEHELFFVSNFNVSYETAFSSPMVGNFFDKLMEIGLLSNYNFGFLYKDDSNQTDENREFFMTIRSTVSDQRIEQIIKPKGKYLVIYHRGTPEKFNQSINHLKKFAINQQIKLKQNYFCDYIWDEIVTKQRDDVMCKVSVEIDG